MSTGKSTGRVRELFRTTREAFSITDEPMRATQEPAVAVDVLPRRSARPLSMFSGGLVARV